MTDNSFISQPNEAEVPPATVPTFRIFDYDSVVLLVESDIAMYERHVGEGRKVFYFTTKLATIRELLEEEELSREMAALEVYETETILSYDADIDGSLPEVAEIFEGYSSDYTIGTDPEVAELQSPCDDWMVGFNYSVFEILLSSVDKHFDGVLTVEVGRGRVKFCIAHFENVSSPVVAILRYFEAKHLVKLFYHVVVGNKRAYWLAVNQLLKVKKFRYGGAFKHFWSYAYGLLKVQPALYHDVLMGSYLTINEIFELKQSFSEVILQGPAEVVETMVQVAGFAAGLDASLYFLCEGQLVRAAAQMMLMLKGQPGALRVASRIYNAMSTKDYTMDDEATYEFNFLGGLEGDESDYDPNADSEVVLQSPDDFVAFFKSTLWMKFTAAISAVCVPEVLSALPRTLSKIAVTCAEVLGTVFHHTNMITAVQSFLSTLGNRLQAFFTTWDFREFLRDGAWETWLVRGADLLAAAPRSGLYVTYEHIVEVMSLYLDEGESYRRKELHKMVKKFTVAHERMLTEVRTLRNRYKTFIISASDRVKEPFSFISLGPPGVGKTSDNKEMAMFAISQNPERSTEGRKLSGTDIYTVVKSKHWTGCKDPVLVCFNDLPGDGYSQNDDICTPEMLRLAVDISPFNTPQADLIDKDFNVINPEIVSVTSNDMRWNFSTFGTNWSKLVRRYPNIYYIAYPSEFYSRDITADSDDHGILINPLQQIDDSCADRMRIYRCAMFESAGTVSFKRTSFLGVGKEILLLDIKKRFLHHKGRGTYEVSAKACCCMGTAISYHEQACLPGCDWGVELQGPFSRVRLPTIFSNCYSNMMDRMVDGTTTNAARIVSSRIFDAIEEAYRKYAGAMWQAAGWAMLLGTAINAYKTIKRSRKKVETVQAMVNPTAQPLQSDLIVRYGLGKGVLHEMPNPPKYPETMRAHAFVMPNLRTNVFTEVYAKVMSNFVCFKGGYKGLFVDSRTLILNKHSADAMIGKSFLLEGDSVDLQFTLRFEEYVRVPGKDICFVKTPSFPASSIRHLFVDEVGKLCMGRVGARELEELEIKNVDFGGKAACDVVLCATYKSGGVSGDCGTPVIASINGHGCVIGIHNAKLLDDTGAAVIVTLRDLAYSPASPGLVVLPVVDKVQCLASQSSFRAATPGTPLLILGTIAQSNKPTSSRLKVTRLNDVCKMRLREERVIPTLGERGRIVEGEWKAPYTHKFDGMVPRPDNFSMSELDKALADYVERMPFMQLTPLNLDEAIGGVPGSKMQKHVNLATSSGIYQHFYADKRDLIDLVSISEDFKRTMVQYIAILEDNIVAEHQKWSLKDELVSVKKESVKKYRYFMVSDLHNLLAFRMFLGPLVNWMYVNKAFFEAYGAFNPASPEFAETIAEMQRFPFLVMADLKHMDSSHKSLVIDYVAKFFVHLAASSGYNVLAQKVVSNLVTSIVFTIFELSGDLGFVNEGMGSGVYITFIVNCIVCSLLYRLAWFRLSTTAFREHNRLITGGDDSAMTTDDARFGMVWISRVWKDFSYVATPPSSKDVDVKDFYSFDEFVFLKRSPKVLCYNGAEIVVGALDQDSIWKSLGWWLPSTEVTLNDRMAQVLDAGQREMALHGKEAFDDYQAAVAGYYAFRRLSWRVCIEKYQIGIFYDDLLDKNYASATLATFQGVSLERNIPDPIDHGSLPDMQWRTKRRDLEKGESPLGALVFTRDNRFVKAATYKQRIKGGRYKNKYSSDTFIGKTSGTDAENRTTVFNLTSTTLAGGEPMHPGADYALPGKPMTISESLGRPVWLTTFNWTPTSPTSTTFSELYGLWFADSYVYSKLQGYKFWRGRPVLRFVVNGFSFYYGKLVFAADLNPGADGYEGTFNPKINSITLNNIAQALQCNHVSIDPSQSATYDLQVPFYSTSGWYNMFSQTTAPSINLSAWIVAGLASANNVAPTSVNVQVYMMMEDVELTIPSVSALQGPAEEEEGGIFSKPASILAKATGVLAMIPALSPFMTPFSQGLTFASGVAKWLGYAKPPSLEFDRPVLNNTNESLSLMEGRAQVDRLVGDPKQSVAITAAAAMVGDDNDMMIASIIKRPGLVAQFAWTTSGFTGTIPVTPMNLFTVSPAQMTPLGFVSNLFTYWTGSIVFRIEVVASAYHRGAFGVSWVPYNVPASTNYLGYPNRFLTHIIDMAGSKNVDFTVPYGADKPVLCTNEGAIQDSSQNGFLQFYEINPLKSAGSTSSVTINVYMFAGDDFDLFRPTTRGLTAYTTISVATVQGPEDVMSVESAETKPVVGTDIALVENAIDQRAALYFGERFLSIKKLLNRHYPAFVFSENAVTFDAGNEQKHMFINPLPMPAQILTFPGLSVNVDNTLTPAAYLSTAFLTMRGGMRYKIMRTNPTVMTVSTAVLTMKPCEILCCSTGFNFAGGSFTVNQQSLDPDIFGPGAIDFIKDQGLGTSITQTTIHPFIEVEVPYTARTRFINPRKCLPWFNISANTEYLNFAWWPRVVPVVGDRESFQGYQAVADDFSLHGFMYVPTLYSRYLGT